jgi:hypothetical protein
MIPYYEIVLKKIEILIFGDTYGGVDKIGRIWVAKKANIFAYRFQTSHVPFKVVN